MWVPIGRDGWPWDGPGSLPTDHVPSGFLKPVKGWKPPDPSPMKASPPVPEGGFFARLIDSPYFRVDSPYFRVDSPYSTKLSNFRIRFVLNFQLKKGYIIMDVLFSNKI